MILSHKPDVNPDDYCYDTGLDFGAAFGERLLDDILNKPEIFEQRFKYKRGDTYKSLVQEVGAESARELNRRKLQWQEYYPDQKPIKFLQWFLPKDRDDEFYSVVPQWLFELYPNEPKTIVQTSQNGEYLPPHNGHGRLSSMFMLLQGQGQETRWYRETAPFKTFSTYSIPDIDKLEHVVTAVMKPYRWYVFNHNAWHSVHNFAAGGVRVNMGLDFDHVPAPELVQVIKERGRDVGRGQS